MRGFFAGSKVPRRAAKRPCVRQAPERASACWGFYSRRDSFSARLPRRPAKAPVRQVAGFGSLPPPEIPNSSAKQIKTASPKTARLAVFLYSSSQYICEKAAALAADCRFPAARRITFLHTGSKTRGCGLNFWFCHILLRKARLFSLLYNPPTEVLP